MNSTSLGAAEAEAERARADAGLDQYEPVPDIVTVMESLDLPVVVKPFGRDALDGIYVRRADIVISLLNSSKYLPRYRFTGAHELAHHRCRHTTRVDVDVYSTQDDPQESMANAFAACFLMPTKGLWAKKARNSMGDPETVLTLANEYMVSYQTMVSRLHNVGIFKAPARDSLMAARTEVLTDELRSRRPSQEFRLPSDYVRRALRAYENYEISLERLAELIHEDKDELIGVLAERSFLRPEDEPA
jgi:Zn-dependent peptidase ImmA (M78 family)